MGGEGRERDKPLFVQPVRGDGSVIDPSGGGSGGTVDQGAPNAGGAQAWPVKDAPVLAALGSPAQSGEAASAAAGLASVLGNPAQEPTLQSVAAGLASILARLDVALSTRATEATLAAIKTDADAVLAKLDVALSTRASEATLALLKARADLLASEATLALVKAKTDNLDVALSTRATEATLAALKARADLLATEATVASIKTDTAAIVVKLDVALSTRASEATLAALKTTADGILAKLDVALSTRASEATLATAAASLGVMDDWDANDRAKTSPIPGQDGIAAGAGASSALTPRVVTASDDANLASLKVVGPGAEAAAQRVTLSTEALTALELIGIKGKDGAAIASDTNAVPVAPIPGQAGVAAGAGAVSALTQRMTLASDDPAVASLGTDGAAPPSIAGTGVRGWLRAIYAILLAVWDSTAGRLLVAPGRPSERAGGTHVMVYMSAIGSGTYTVPAGKTLYITSAWVVAFSAVLTNATSAYLASASPFFVIIQTGVDGALSTQQPAANHSCSFPEPLAFAAGTVISLGATSSSASAGFAGYTV